MTYANQVETSDNIQFWGCAFQHCGLLDAATRRTENQVPTVRSLGRPMLYGSAALMGPPLPPATKQGWAPPRLDGLALDHPEKGAFGGSRGVCVGKGRLTGLVREHRNPGL